MTAKRIRDAVPGVNFNSLLIGIVIAVCGFIAKKEIESGEVLATTVQQVKGLQAEVTEIKPRITAAERDIIDLRVYRGSVRGEQRTAVAVRPSN